MAESTVVSCPTCGKKFKIGADKLGRTFKCTGCETRFKAGEESEVISAPPVTAASPAPTRRAPAITAAIADTSSEPAGDSPAGESSADPGETPKRGSKLVTVSLIIIVVLLGLGAGFYFLGWPKVQAMIERSHRAQCASNLHDISKALIDYDGANHAYPPDLATLWKWKPTLKGSIFVCPSSDDTPAADPSQLLSGKHLSFAYIQPMDLSPGMGPPADFVVLYDQPANHQDEGMNIGFGDGRVEWKKSIEATALIAKSPRHLMTSATQPATTLPTDGTMK